MSGEARDALAVALASALHDQGFGCNRYRCSIGRGSSADAHEQDARFLADAILAALPDGWVLARREDAEDGASVKALIAALPDTVEARVSHSEDSGNYRVKTPGAWFADPSLAAAARKATDAIGGES